MAPKEEWNGGIWDRDRREKNKLDRVVLGRGHMKKNKRRCRAIGIAGIFMLHGLKGYHDYRGIHKPAYAKLQMLMEADRLHLQRPNPKLLHVARLVFSNLVNASCMLRRMSPRPDWEYFIARIFGIPSLCCQEGRLAVSSANVRYNGSEMHAAESSSISIAQQC